MAWLPGAWLRLAHLAALWGLAFVQPLFDLLGRNAEFFIARGNGRADILIFALAFVVVPPVLMLAVEGFLAKLSRPAAGLLHLVLVALLVTAFVLGALNESSGLPTGALILLALAVGAAAGFAYRGAGVVRSLVSFLAPAPAVFLAIFLVFSEAGELVRPTPDIQTFAVDGTRDAPVLLVIFDELPVATLMDSDGTIDARRFPNFARLERTSTWYREATAVADRTAEAVPAILTGNEAEAGLTPTAADHPRNIFTLFADSYPVNAWESATRLCPVSVCDRSGDALTKRLGSLASDLRVVSEHLLLPESLTTGLPPVDQAFFGFGGGDESRHVEGLDSDRLTGLLEGIDRTGGERSLNFVHFDTPHVPWRRLPTGRSCQGDTWDATHMIGSGGAWINNAWATKQALGAHLLQAGYADRLLGRLIDGLDERGIWDRAAVTVIADHGVAFDPGGLRRTITPSNAGATLRVPMFVKAPGQHRGEVSARHARTVDILPTIADLVGVELPFAVDGQVADQVEADTRVSAYAQDPAATQSIPRAKLEVARNRLTVQKEALLGPRGSLDQVFAMGPSPGLINKPVTPIDAAGDEEGSFELVGPEAYTDVNLEEEVPCQLVANLEGVEAGEPLAVVVNGSIAATTRSYEAATGAVQAFALIDPSSFESGDNAVSLWRIAAGGFVPLTPAG